MEEYVREAAAEYKMDVSFVRSGSLVGGGGTDGLGDRFYKTYPEYNKMLSERMHDNGQCDYEVAAGDVLPLTKTNRKILAKSVVAALECDPCEFGVISQEGAIEQGPYPDTKEWVKIIRGIS